MLKIIFAWLDQNPNSYWFIVLGPSLLLITWIFVLIWRQTHNPPAPKPRALWIDAILLFIFLLAWRWPYLLVADEFNPDEGMQIAGAITLAHDPVFWRSVDGTTSGPLNFYILLPLRWLSLPLDYFTARLAGLIFIWGSLFACLRTLTRFFTPGVAWLGVMPVAALFATATNTDLIHYSTEHLSMLILAVAIMLLAGRNPGDMSRLWVAGCLAGSLPLAKLQTVPISVTLLCWCLGQALVETGQATSLRLRRVVSLGLAAAAPCLLMLTMLTLAGQTDAAVRRYFLHNLFYVSNTSSLADAMGDMSKLAMADGRFPLLLATSLVGLIAAVLYFSLRRVRPTALLIIGGWLTFAALVAILTPRRGFLHYLLLLPVPLTVFLGAVIGTWWENLRAPRSRLLLATVFLFTSGFLPLITRCLQPVPSIYGDFSYHWRHPQTSAAVVVQAIAGRDGLLGVWGWANRLYVETGLGQATRDAASIWSIQANNQIDYHRSNYLADLRRNSPAVFVDAVGPGAFTFNDRAVQAHEVFPELADYIHQHYSLVTDLAEVRIYARNDLAALQHMNPARLDQLVSQGRMKNRGVNPVPPTITPLEIFQRKVIGMRTGIMLPPPARVEWLLDGNVRAVSFEFGFDPLSYLKGTSNGADILLELVYAGQTRTLYRRRLDPAHQPSDCGPHASRILLPPFSLGTRLVLRTEPGENGDAAWDWIYLASLQFLRSPEFRAEQFPGFNRMPDSAIADGSALIQNETGTLLQMHAPASLTFRLNGREQRMQLTYGILPGAYTNGGNTDGAIFRVELNRPGQTATIIFERYLQPVTNPADRGRQLDTFMLPGVSQRDHLEVIIDPGPGGNGAWDWTYISGLRLIE